MQAKVDWLAFTVPTEKPFSAIGESAADAALWQLGREFGGLLQPIVSAHSWEVKKGRRFYHTTVTDNETKLIVSVGDVNAHIYVEIGGQACDNLRTLGIFDNLLAAVGATASRVDLAIDFENDVKPADFVVNRDSRRFNGSADIRSINGDTYYVGSRKSEQFVRVYRYHEPHPRSHLLRVEVELHSQKAKSAVQSIVANGLLQTVASANAPYKWRHPCWQLGELEVSRLEGRKSDREGSSTLRWLIGTCASALLKAHREGLIDAQTWFDTYVQAKLQE